MRKILTLLLAILMVCTLAGCSKKADEPVNSGEEGGNEVVDSNEATDIVSAYTVVNSTGENVTELYLYLTGSEDKGPNLLVDPMADSMTLVLDETVYTELATVKSDADKASETFVLEFVTESGYIGSFDTLRREVATISLLSADVAAGATQIAFITNVENVTPEAE